MPQIRPATTADATAIAAIYNHFIAETVVTFEEDPLSSDILASRIQQVAGRYPWLVLEEQDRLCGYAYLNEWKTRTAFRYSAELSIYLDPAETGKGYGSRLMEAIIARGREAGLHRLIGGIALPNHPSVVLHERFGFRKIGHFSEVGYKFDRWVDVGYWELNLEERTA